MTDMAKSSLGRILPVLFGFFVMGFCDVVGIATSYVKQDFSLSETVAGFIPSMVFVWFLLLSIPAAMWMNRIGRKRMVQLSNVITFIGMLIPFIHYSFPTCMAGFVLLGIGNTILQVSLNPLLTNVVSGSRLTSMLTAGQVIKAVSSFCGPFIAAFALTVLGEWRFLFPIFAGITFLSMLWLMLTEIPKETSVSGTSSLGATFSILKDKTILLLFLGIFFVVGVDVGVNYISSKLMAGRFAWTAQQVKFAPQVYFLCRTAGALLGAFLLTKIAASRYFRVNILACAASMLVLLFVPDDTVAIVAIGCVGFFASSVFSIIYSFALQEKPEKANDISGMMITAVAGGAVIPPLMGFAIGKTGITGGLVVILLCVVYLAFLSFNLKEAREA